MGIGFLLAKLEKGRVEVNYNIRSLKGKTVAIDGHQLLYKGGLSRSKDGEFSVAQKLMMGEKTNEHVDYCLNRIDTVKSWGVVPHLVFDGDQLPLKANCDRKRLIEKVTDLERAREFYKMGDPNADKLFKSALKISAMMAHDLIKVLIDRGEMFTVAPFEADSQISFLFREKRVDAVISDDADSVIFGCKHILYKVAYESGTCKSFYCDWPENFDEIVKFPNTAENLLFNNFSRNMIINFAVLFGCDYSSPLPNMGFKHALELIETYRTRNELFKHFKETGRMGFNEEYMLTFDRAVEAFKFATVYDSKYQKRKPLEHNEIGIINYLGGRIDDNVKDEILIAEGKMHPTCHVMYNDEENLHLALVRRQLLLHLLSLKDIIGEYAEFDPTKRYGRYTEILNSRSRRTTYRALDCDNCVEVEWTKVTGALWDPKLENLQMLMHANLMRFYMAWMEGNTLNIITDHSSSGSLREHIQKHHRVSEKALKNWTRQILMALTCLHTNNPCFIHRGLSCSNIFIHGVNGQVKVGGVELALTGGIINEDASIKGTPGFIAPEDDQYSTSADMYLFGVCLVEISTQEIPNRENIELSKLKEVLKGKKILDIIELCLAQPADRPSAADLLKNLFFSDEEEIAEDKAQDSHAELVELRRVSFELRDKFTRSVDSMIRDTRKISQRGKLKMPDHANLRNKYTRYASRLQHSKSSDKNCLGPLRKAYCSSLRLLLRREAQEVSKELRARTNASRSPTIWPDGPSTGSNQSASFADTSSVSDAYSEMLAIFIPCLVDESSFLARIMCFEVPARVPPGDLGNGNRSVPTGDANGGDLGIMDIDENDNDGKRSADHQALNESLHDLSDGIQGVLYAFVDWADDVDPLHCISMHGITERYISGLEDDAAGFIFILLDDLKNKISTQFSHFVDDACYRIKRNERNFRQVQVFSYIPRFSTLASCMEQYSQGSSRDLVDQAYTQLLTQMFDSLERIAQADPENADIFLLENYEAFQDSVYNLANVVPTLAKFYQQASVAYKQAGRRFLNTIVLNQFEQFFQFFDTMEDLMCEFTLEEIPAQRGLSNMDLRRVVDSSLSRVDKSVRAMRKSLKKNLTSKELLPSLWKDCKRLFLKKYKRFARLVTKIYPTEIIPSVSEITDLLEST